MSRAARGPKASRALLRLAWVLAPCVVGACGSADSSGPNDGDGMVASDAGSDAATADDVASRREAAPPPDAATEAQTPPPGAIKLHPGHYLWDYTDKWEPTAQQTLANTVSFLKNEPNFRGVELQLSWYYLEGATQGDYTPISTTLADAAAKLAAIGKRLAINMVVTSPYNSFDPLYPTYVVDNGWVVTLPNGARVPDMANSKAMAALADVGKALAKQFDASPYFEWFCPWYDLSFDAPQWQSGSYGQGTYYKSLAALFGAVAPAFAHTLVRVMSSFTGYPNEMWALFAQLRQYPNILYGGTDPDGPSPDNPYSWGGQAFLGKPVGGAADPNAFGSMVGKYPYVTQMEGYLNHGTVGGATIGPDAVANYAVNTMGAYYIVWNHQVTDASSASITSPLASPNFGFSSHVQPYVDSVGGAMRSGEPSVGSWKTQ